MDAYLSVYQLWQYHEYPCKKKKKRITMRLIKPLINPYTKWTYSFEAGNHVTQNMFWTDSFYHTDIIKYHYFNYDGWIGWNTGAYKVKPGTNEDDRLRTLVSLRYFKQRYF